MLIYLLCSLIALILSRIEQYALSGFVLILAGIYLYLKEYRYSGSLINLRGVFCLSFVFGEGLAAMKLSYLAKPWNNITWICFTLAILSFYTVFEFLSKKNGSPYLNKEGQSFHRGIAGRMFASIIVTAFISLIAFNIEALLLGFIPLFERGVPHAYSYFHISGLHYITVSCILIPALSVIYLNEKKDNSIIQIIFLIISNIIAFLIPILCVSRFQFMLAVLLAFVTFLILKRDRIKPVYFIAVVCITVPVYLILSVARSHDVSYLMGIFEMKYNLPIYFSQPYIYIANNYDNFDTLVRELPAHSMGVKGLFPLWALSGLKFIYPKLVDFPIFVNKTELTTVTLFYDAFYDFGIFGVGIFSGVLVAVSYSFERLIRGSGRGFSYMLYAQYFIYLSLSFFTTWFSNPATWFYFIITIIVYIYSAGGLVRRGSNAGEFAKRR